MVDIVAGQSNADSWGTLNQAFPGGWITDPLDKIWSFYTNTWETYVPGVNSDTLGQLAIGYSHDPGGMCWGMEAQHLLQERIKHPLRPRYIFKRAYPNSGVAVDPAAQDWSPSSSGEQFDWMASSLATALAALPAAALRKVDKFFWIGNESDTLTQARADACYNNMLAFVSGARSWPHCENAMFITQRVRDSSYWPYRAAVRAAQEAIGALPGNACVNTDDLIGDHYIPASVVELGRRCSAA